MEQRIRERFHDAILQEAMRRYGIAAGQIHLLDGFESFMYEYRRGSSASAYILRISHSIRRNEVLIQGEVDWINTLAAGGVSVARAIRSDAGNLVEAVDDGQGGQFLATAFIKAPGRPPNQAGWTPALFESYGQLLGRMHALAKSYQPAQPTWKRPEWNDDLMEFVEHFLPASQTVVKEKYHTLLNHLNALPKDNASYGLIHQDAHGGNFLVDDAGTLTLFDFDDCVYSWFANDIAIVLFYIVTNVEDAPAFTRGFMPHFLRGYHKANSLDPWWLREIPAFLKLREIELYAVLHRDFDVDHIDDPWCARFMQGRRYKIEHDVPYIDFDFESLGGFGS